jgi:hypothetical protein
MRRTDRGETRAQILEREEKVWEASDKGWTPRRIAAELGLSHTGVRRILDRIATRAIKELNGRELHRKIAISGQQSHIVEAALDQWRESCKPQTRVIERKDDDGTTTTTSVVEQTGTVAYLHTAMAAMDRLVRLWGLDVIPASQDGLQSISALAADIVKRAKDHERREQAATLSTVDPAGIPPALEGGTPSMPDKPPPVQ